MSKSIVKCPECGNQFDIKVEPYSLEGKTLEVSCDCHSCDHTWGKKFKIISIIKEKE